MTEDITLDGAMLLMNDWLRRPVRLLVLIRDGAPPDALPPSGPAEGWHVLLVREASLGRPPVETDWERQLTVGTYQIGDDSPLKLLLADLPCERIVALGEEERPPHRLAFYLPGSRVVLLLERLADS